VTSSPGPRSFLSPYRNLDAPQSQTFSPAPVPAAILDLSRVSNPETQALDPDPTHRPELTWSAAWAAPQRGPRTQTGDPCTLAREEQRPQGRARRGSRSTEPQLEPVRGQPLPPRPSAQSAGQPSPPLAEPVRKAALVGDAALRPAPSNREFSYWSKDPARPGNRRLLDECVETAACYWSPGVSVPADDRSPP
jgi:hypothetical protein